MLQQRRFGKLLLGWGLAFDGRLLALLLAVEGDVTGLFNCHAEALVQIRDQLLGGALLLQGQAIALACVLGGLGVVHSSTEVQVIWGVLIDGSAMSCVGLFSLTTALSQSLIVYLERLGAFARLFRPQQV